MTALQTRPAARALDPERPTIVLVSVLLGFESVLYSVLTPVLPHYAHAFGASKPAIGVLAASYPAGMLPGALLGLAVGMLGLPGNAEGWGRPTRGPLFMSVAADLRPAAYAGSTHFEPVYAYELALLLVLTALSAVLLLREHRMPATGRGGYSSLACVALLGLGIGALRPLTLDAMSDVAVLRIQAVCALLAAAALGVLLMRLFDAWRTARERQELLEVHQIWQARRQEFIDHPAPRRLTEATVPVQPASEEREQGVNS